MKLSKKELGEIVDCIDYVTNQLRTFNKIYKQRDTEYQFGYLNYLVELRNKITTDLNKDINKEQK